MKFLKRTKISLEINIEIVDREDYGTGCFVLFLKAKIWLNIFFLHVIYEIMLLSFLPSSLLHIYDPVIAFPTIHILVSHTALGCRPRPYCT